MIQLTVSSRIWLITAEASSLDTNSPSSIVPAAAGRFRYGMEDEGDFLCQELI